MFDQHSNHTIQHFGTSALASSVQPMKSLVGLWQMHRSDWSVADA